MCYKYMGGGDIGGPGGFRQWEGGWGRGSMRREAPQLCTGPLQVEGIRIRLKLTTES